MQTKICNTCNKEKPLSEFYSQIIKSKTKGEYIRYNLSCKQCVNERSKKWRTENKDRYRYLINRRDNGKQDYLRDLSKQRRLNGKYKIWQRKNKDKIKQYNLYREMNKSHKISKKEWESCLDYFNNSCAYCGISNNEAKQRYKNYLHKDHVDHEGANDLSNCIPACKSCNSSKHTFKLEEWYNENNINFEEERLIKIHKWLNEDYKLYINKN